MMGAYSQKQNKALFKEDIERIYERFPRLAERRTQIAGTLSGGEQHQRAWAHRLLICHLHTVSPFTGNAFQRSIYITAYIISDRIANLKRQHCDRGVREMCAAECVVILDFMWYHRGNDKF